MSISANELYEKIQAAGAASDVMSQLFLEQTLELAIGRPLHAEEVMEDLLSVYEFQQEDQALIRSVLSEYEGQRVVVFSHPTMSVADMVKDHPPSGRIISTYSASLARDRR